MEGSRGAEIIRGGMDVTDAKEDIGAKGAIVGTDAGIDRFGILPMPRRETKLLVIAI